MNQIVTAIMELLLWLLSSWRLFGPLIILYAHRLCTKRLLRVRRRRRRLWAVYAPRDFFDNVMPEAEEEGFDGRLFSTQFPFLSSFQQNTFSENNSEDATLGQQLFT
ncbi:hypothetical protein M514_08944 [Trichuris suis]|uniref:Uncharacterized protein n=1 Tax=Trichuris suis TaxID=68888 RepID=A0A085NLQ8_9BILA|nr:hypothetical protein M513_08944 [Trichuris suis]KFD70404.1 hypothetical protein M514_08944 [Trichuris suis]